MTADGTKKALADFRAEATAIRKLAHPQIPAAYTMGIHDDGTPYLVMEWLEGKTLKDRLDQEGALSEAAALKIVEQLAKPLAHAHAHGLVHRDLKPANVFELPDGTVKLIDFGLAKYFGPAAERGRRPPTASNELKGTFWFMSPEAARGKPLDARADVYSLGAVLYNLLTGHLPFDDRFTDQNVPLVVALAQGQRPLDVRKYRPVRDDVADLVLQLMAVEPAARFQTMDEVERVTRAISLDPDKPLTAKPDDRTVARLTGKEMPTRVTQSGAQSGAVEAPPRRARGRRPARVRARLRARRRTDREARPGADGARHERARHRAPEPDGDAAGCAPAGCAPAGTRRSSRVRARGDDEDASSREGRRREEARAPGAARGEAQGGRRARRRRQAPALR